MRNENATVDYTNQTLRDVRDIEDARPAGEKSPLRSLFTKTITRVEECPREISIHELIENASMITSLLKPFIKIEKRRAVLMKKLNAVENVLDELARKKYALRSSVFPHTTLVSLMDAAK